MTTRPRKRKPGEINSRIATAIGKQYAKRMEPVCTLQEIADELGVSRGRAQQLCEVALGKFAWKLKQRFPDYEL